jgi:hypothetical protein
MNMASVPQKQRKSRKKPRTNELSASKALTEALSIAREAETRVEAEPEIDWTRDPLNEREKRLRDAIIRRVEAEDRLVIERGNERLRELTLRLHGRAPTEEDLASDAASVACHVARKLESLVKDQLKLEDRYGYDSDYTIGGDLMDRIEHWEGITKENAQRERRLERDRLLREAKLDI